MLFVTACDNEYLPFVVAQMLALDKHFGQRPIVYDLGMSSERKKWLRDDMNTEVLPRPHAPEPGANYPADYRPRALFKPIMLLNACLRFNDEIVYLDADAWPTCHFKFPAKELGLTRVQNWDRTLYTGPLHSGVIFIGRTSKRINFLLGWAKDLWDDYLPSDKKSLNQVVPRTELDVTLLSANEYNARQRHPETKIMHPKRVA